MNATQTRRVIEAFAETQALLAKELTYEAAVQRADRIAFYRAHIAKLQGMLAA